jgi:hypothetical protein
MYKKSLTRPEVVQKFGFWPELVRQPTRVCGVIVVPIAKTNQDLQLRAWYAELEQMAARRVPMT